MATSSDAVANDLGAGMASSAVGDVTMEYKMLASFVIVSNCRHEDAVSLDSDTIHIQIHV